MYRFVLLSIGFNLNMVYLYLTFSPLSQSVSQSVVVCVTLSMLVVGFRKKPPLSLYVLVCVAALKTRAADLSFYLCPSVPVDTTMCYGVSTARIIEQRG